MTVVLERGGSEPAAVAAAQGTSTRALAEELGLTGAFFWGGGVVAKGATFSHCSDLSHSGACCACSPASPAHAQPALCSSAATANFISCNITRAQPAPASGAILQSLRHGTCSRCNTRTTRATQAPGVDGCRKDLRMSSHCPITCPDQLRRTAVIQRSIHAWCRGRQQRAGGRDRQLAGAHGRRIARRWHCPSRQLRRRHQAQCAEAHRKSI